MQKSLANKRILLVHMSAGFFSELIGQCGSQIFYATNAKDALINIAKNPYDLVIVGTRIPNYENSFTYCCGNDLLRQMLSLRQFEYARLGSSPESISSDVKGHFIYPVGVSFELLADQIRIFFGDKERKKILILADKTLSLKDLFPQELLVIQTLSLSDMERAIRYIPLDYILIGPFVLFAALPISGNQVAKGIQSTTKIPFGRLVLPNAALSSIEYLCDVAIGEGLVGDRIIDLSITNEALKKQRIGQLAHFIQQLK